MQLFPIFSNFCTSITINSCLDVLHLNLDEEIWRDGLMKAMFALIVIVLLAPSVSAKPEEISVGPYNVSFNLNTPMNYTVTSDYHAEKGNTSGHVKIRFDDDTQAIVGISAFDAWQYAGIPRSEFLYMNLALKTDKNITSSNVSELSIDGKDGLIVQAQLRPTGEKARDYAIAIYWPDSKMVEGFDFPVGKTKVEIVAKLPDKLNLEMLNSIHVTLPKQAGESAVKGLNSNISPQGQGALDMNEMKTSQVFGGKVNQKYDRATCIETYRAMGYPTPIAEFSCD